MAKKKNPAQGGAHDRMPAGHGANSNSRSTATGAQHARILHALSQRAHTSDELRGLGCYQANTRILELRRKGYDIRTTLVSIWDRDGYQHSRVALYSLGVGK